MWRAGDGARPAPTGRVLAAAALAVVMLAACSGGGGASSGTGDAKARPTRAATPSAAPSPAPSPAKVTEVWLGNLAAISAKATYTASYAFTDPSGKSKGTVRIAKATVGYRLDVRRAGRTAVLIANGQGVYQCSLGSKNAACARVAAAGATVPARLDPRLQRVFVEWPALLASRTTTYDVRLSTNPPTKRGSCFDIAPLPTTGQPRADAGTYCFGDDGAVTALRYPSGTLLLRTLGKAPKSFALPAPAAHR